MVKAFVLQGKNQEALSFVLFIQEFIVVFIQRKIHYLPQLLNVLETASDNLELHYSHNVAMALAIIPHLKAHLKPFGDLKKTHSDSNTIKIIADHLCFFHCYILTVLHSKVGDTLGSLWPASQLTLQRNCAHRLHCYAHLGVIVIYISRIYFKENIHRLQHTHWE